MRDLTMSVPIKWDAPTGEAIAKVAEAFQEARKRWLDVLVKLLLESNMEIVHWDAIDGVTLGISSTNYSKVTKGCSKDNFWGTIHWIPGPGIKDHQVMVSTYLWEQVQKRRS